MSIFIVEHEVKGYPLIEVIRGVEDIDLSMFSQIKTLWVCDNETEVSTVEKELKEKHARHSEQT